MRDLERRHAFIFAVGVYLCDQDKKYDLFQDVLPWPVLRHAALFTVQNKLRTTIHTYLDFKYLKKFSGELLGDAVTNYFCQKRVLYDNIQRS